MINASRAAFVCLFKFKVAGPLAAAPPAVSGGLIDASGGGSAGRGPGCWLERGLRGRARLSATSAGSQGHGTRRPARRRGRRKAPCSSTTGAAASLSAVNGQVQPQAEGPASDGEARPRLADQSETATSPRPPVRIVQQRTCRLLCKYTRETHDAITALRTTPAASGWVGDSMHPLAPANQAAAKPEAVRPRGWAVRH
jgi:hypothetical protein